MSKAICDLDGYCRWAVTGTPIQNQLGDLATLLKFIRAYPYNERRRFDAHITNVWKEGRDSEAVDRLKRLSSCLVLRRPKATIKLPPKRDMECPVELTEPEREAYTELREAAIAKVDEAIHQSSDINRSGVYANVLQQIESLRLFCNLGLHYHSRHEEKGWANLAVFDKPKWSEIAQKTFNVYLEQGQTQCWQCSSSLDLNHALFEDPTAQDNVPLFSSCLRYFCRDCTSRMSSKKHTIDCGHSPPCDVAPVSTSIQTLEDISEEVPQAGRAALALPSKVEKLVADIQRQPPNVKR